MSLQLIMGGAGSGKTTFLYDRLIEESIRFPDQKYILIVPEQFTMQTQKDIVRMHPDHCTMNIDIVSFQRLAFRIFEELSLPQPDILDECGKSMVLRKVLTLCRKDLVLYAGHEGQAGFIERLKSTISEFTQYGVGPDDLDEMADKAKTPLLRQKITEFSVIYRAFNEFISGHYITNEQILDVLCRILPDSDLIRGSVIALDGFAGFMPVQYRILNLFMTLSRQVIVTVTADESVPADKKLGMQQLFFVPSQVICRLKASARENGVPVLKDIRLSQGSHRDGELIFLEKNLFRYTQSVYEGEDTGGIRFTEAQDPKEEVSYLVGEILRLVKEEDYRYRDIAVVTGDLDGYGKELLRQFGENAIPCFLDEKKSMLDHPLVELLRAALEVMDSDFSCESVFRYLRSGLISQEAEMTDRMENYVLALGIKGKSNWKKEWDRIPRAYKNLNLDELNAFKDEVTAPLFALDEIFSHKDKTIGEMVDGLSVLLESLGAVEKCERLQDDLRAGGEARLASEYSQVNGLIENLFERLKSLLGDERAGRREFADILDAGLSEISVGVIPATSDRVVMGDLMRTRLAHVRALFIIGVNDGIIPSKKEGGSLFTDPEREFFAANHRELAPTAREDSFRQRFFLYSLMGKPTNRLYISYTLAGADSKGRRESYLCGELRRMFPDIVTVKYNGRLKKSAVYSGSAARTELIDTLQDYQETGIITDPDIIAYFDSSDEGRKELSRLMEAAFKNRTGAPIDSAVARVLYGRVMEGSVTRLEKYAACAYAHFLRYGLELMERPVYEIQAVDLGNLFHDSIERCFKKADEGGLDWKIMSDETRRDLVHQAVAEETEEYGDTILSSSFRNRYLACRVENITQKTVWALQNQIKKGDFIPSGFELSFSAKDHLRALSIPLENGAELMLTGRIDRLDLLKEGTKIYVKIIDYKSGSTTFDLSSLYNGLQLQLIFYLDAAMEMTGRDNPGKDIVPAGVFYYNIKDPLINKDKTVENPDGTINPAAVDRAVLKQLKMNGLCNEDPEVIHHMDHGDEGESDVIPVVFKDGRLAADRSSVADTLKMDKLKSFVRERARQSGDEILKGTIEVNPYKDGQDTACEYCPYHSVCAFDVRVPGQDYRKFRKMKPEEIWEEICR